MPLLRPRTSPHLAEGPARWVSELLPSPLFLIGEDGRIQESGGGTFSVFGLRPSDLTGSSIEACFQPESLAGLRALASDARVRSGSVSAELLARNRRGDGIPVRVVARAISGRPEVGLYLVDLREREALVETLAQRAAELARSNRDLEQFAYVASHDLQEPLRMIGSYTELVQERYHGRLDSEADEFLGYAHDGVVRMRQLIDDLLTYARIGSRAEPFRTLSVREPLDRALSNLQDAVRRESATVEIGSMPEIEGDSGQLTQVFQNLIGNAIKFHGAQPPRVSVNAVRDGAFWQVTIADDGIGIAPEYQEKVFQIFQRLHTREEYPGTGIGLSVCKRVVERHGGRIWVESTGVPGEGTTFHFTLRAEAVAPTPPLEASPEETLLVEQANSLIEDRLRELV